MDIVMFARTQNMHVHICKNTHLSNTFANVANSYCMRPLLDKSKLPLIVDFKLPMDVRTFYFQ